MLVSIETHITCDYPGGSGPLSPSGSAHGFPWGIVSNAFEKSNMTISVRVFYHCSVENHAL